jgi:hypothetical protein
MPSTLGTHTNHLTPNTQEQMELLTRVNVGSEFKQDVILVDPTILSLNRICAIWACTYWGILGGGVVDMQNELSNRTSHPRFTPPSPSPSGFRGSFIVPLLYVICIFQRLGLGSRPTSSRESFFFFFFFL